MTANIENRDFTGTTQIEKPIHLKLLGTFCLKLPEGTQLHISSKKNRAILAILALSPKGQATREKLCELLWGDRGEEQARSSLRQSLAVLRKEFGTFETLLLQSRDEAISLRKDGIKIDVVEFAKYALAANLTSLRLAAEIYDGELLADTSLKDAAFENWIGEQRRNLNDQALAIFEKLAELETRENRVAVAKRLLALDQLREASHRALMNAHWAMGEKALALKQFEVCRQLLKSELDVEPAALTVQLKNKIASDIYFVETKSAASLTNHDKLKETPKPSIAVLPFLNLSDDANQRHIADGLTEDLITDLSKVPGFLVIAANSAFKFRDGTLLPEKAAQELGARYVVQGSIRKPAHHFRVNVKLVDTNSNVVLWADRFDCDFVTMFGMQEEIVSKISNLLGGSVSSFYQNDRYRPKSPEAYELCMRGRDAWRISDDFGVKTIPLFERVIEIDPNYAEAYRWLALGHNFSWVVLGEPAKPARQKALANILKAVELDPQDSSCHWVLGVVLMYEGRLDESAAAYKEAFRLNPNNADAMVDYSDLLVMDGKGQEAVDSCKKAFKLNPYPAGFYFLLLGQAQIAAGDYEGAIATLRDDFNYQPGTRRFLAAALALTGRVDEAQEEGKHYMAANPHFRIAQWFNMVPYRDLKMRQRFYDGHKLAGLPE